MEFQQQGSNMKLIWAKEWGGIWGCKGDKVLGKKVKDVGKKQGCLMIQIKFYAPPGFWWLTTQNDLNAKVAHLGAACPYTNSHQMNLENCLQAQSTFSNWVSKHYITQHNMLFRGKIEQGERKISGVSILLGTLQENVISQAWMTEVCVFQQSQSLTSTTYLLCVC